MAKKDFTGADGAIDRLFTQSKPTNDTKHTKHTTHTAKNKSKHYEGRGLRSQRLGLLLDEQLKNDLKLLAKAMDSKSLNDLIVTALLEYVEREEMQDKIAKYKDFLSR